MKKTAIFSLALLAIGLTLLFIFPQPVAKFALERVLAGTGVKLEQLDGLEIGWDRVQVNNLALTVEGFQQPIRIQGVRADFSVSDARLGAVVVDHLLVPDYHARDSQQSTTPMPRLGSLIRNVHNLPVQAVRVHKITVAALGVLEQLHWQHQIGQQQVQFQHQGFAVELGLTTTVASPMQLQAQVRLNRDSNNLLALDINAAQQGENYLTDVAFDAPLKDWGFVMELLQQRFPLLSKIGNVAGRFGLSLQTHIADDIDLFFKQGFTATVVPDVDVALEYTDDALPLSPLQAKIELNQPIKLVADNTAGNNLKWNMGSVVASLSHRNQQVASVAELTDIGCQQQPALMCSMAIHWSLNAAPLSVAGTQVQSVAAGATGTLTIGDQHITAVLTPGQLLQADNVQQGETTLQTLLVNSLSPVHIAMDRGTGELTITADKLIAKITDVELEQKTVSTELVFDNLQMTQTENLALQTAVAATPIRLQIPGQRLPGFGFAGDLSLRDNKLDVSGTLNSDLAKPLIAVQGQHHINGNSGEVRLRSATEPFAQGENSLAKHFASWPWPLDIVSGHWQMASTLKWRNQGDDLILDGNVHQTLEQLAGNYQDTAFSGLQSTMDARIDSIDRLLSTAPVTVNIQTLDVGLPVSDTQLQFSFDSGEPQVQLHQFTARMLGGDVSAGNVVYRPDGESPATVEINNVDLGELVRLSSSKDISVTGKVSGELPLVIGPDGLRMDQGELRALQPGGVLKYSPDAATQQAIAENPATQFAYQVLGNYHYSVLDADLSYQPDGQLVLASRMYGINPDLNNGQPIKLNPKIEVNVLDTLKSLRIGRAVSDFFEQNLENKMQVP